MLRILSGVTFVSSVSAPSLEKLIRNVPSPSILIVKPKSMNVGRMSKKFSITFFISPTVSEERLAISRAKKSISTCPLYTGTANHLAGSSFF